MNGKYNTPSWSSLFSLVSRQSTIMASLRVCVLAILAFLVLGFAQANCKCLCVRHSSLCIATDRLGACVLGTKLCNNLYTFYNNLVEQKYFFSRSKKLEQLQILYVYFSS